MAKVIDLEGYRSSLKKAQESVSRASPQERVKVEADESIRLIGLQSEIIEALLNDIALLAGKYKEMESQFVMVSAQAYLSLEILKEKGVLTEEELKAKWSELMTSIEDQEKGETEQSQPPPVVDIPGSYQPNEEDLARILDGEDPAKVFAGKFD